MERYDRLINLIKEENFKKMKNATVAVIGCGGVGGYVVECLARCGIGTIIVVDFDTIDITNLNRQIISNTNNIGNKKVVEIKKRVESFSTSKIITLDMFLNKDNINNLFEYNIDYLVDACDTINTKKILITECCNRNIDFISCMGTGNKIDPTKFKIIDLRETKYDPIAKILRKYVKNEKINTKITVVCSDEISSKGNKNITSISYMPAIAGMLCASYITRKIIDSKDEDSVIK